MNRRGLLLGLCAAGLFLSGCGDDKVISSLPAPSASAKRAPRAAPSAERPPPPRPPIEASEFVESEQSRDPFRSYAKSFIEESKGRTRSQREVVMADYTLDELKLIGIVTRLKPEKAMLVDPNGRGHVIQRGQFVGRADVVSANERSGASYEINWRVDRIREGDVVFVREDPQNPDVPTLTRVIPLRPDASLVNR